VRDTSADAALQFGHVVLDLSHTRTVSE
jgi:hypothetical protein